MSINPLAPVTDYQSMLNRISWFTTASALVAIWILRLYIQALDELLHKIDFTVEFGGTKVLPMPGGYLFPALAVGILTRIFRFHRASRIGSESENVLTSKSSLKSWPLDPQSTSPRLATIDW